MTGGEALRLDVVQHGGVIDWPDVDIPALAWCADLYAHCGRALYAFGERKEVKVLFLSASPIHHDEHARFAARDHCTRYGPESIALCAPYRGEFVMSCKCCTVANQRSVTAYPALCESCTYYLKHYRSRVPRIVGLSIAHTRRTPCHRVSVEDC